MPLATFEKHHWIETIRVLRKDPVAAYGCAIAIVAVATLMRWLIGGQLMAGLPFITYYPAIIIATLIGGLWPGVLATVLSVVLAWYLFLPPVYSWQLEPRAALTLLFFSVMASINIALIVYLDSAIDRVMAQEKNVRLLIESAPNGVLVVNDEGRITLVNASMERLFGYKAAELLGKEMELLVPEPAAQTHRQLRQSFLRQPETRPMGQGRDLRGRRKDGSEFPIEIGLNPLERDGKRSVLATVIDISERKRVHEAQQLLIRELNHRTQNLFAVVQAIANQSLDEGKTVTEAKDVLKGRLQALARAYAMVSNSAWHGALLSEILKRQFAGFAARVQMSGCDLIVAPSAAQQFALIIHELSTNALKYGALSVPEGSIGIEGKTTRLDGQGHFSFTWKESGGPPVSAPRRKGFGTVVLTDAAKAFAQEVAIDYEPTGLRYHLRVELAGMVPSDKTSLAFDVATRA